MEDRKKLVEMINSVEIKNQGDFIKYLEKNLISPGIIDEREEKIIRLKFGLDRNGYPRTLEEVGHYFQLTRERIRQIEAKAIYKLKASLRAQKLKPFLEEIFGGSYVR